MRMSGISKAAARLLLLVAMANPVMAGSAAAQDAASAALIFRQLNDTSIAIYRDAKRRLLGETDPVVIAGFDSVLIRQHGAERRVAQTPPAYALLKAIDHVPRSLWAALYPGVAGLDPEAAWRTKLAELRPRVAAALGAVKEAGLPQEAAGRGERTLHSCLGLIDRYLAQGVPSVAQLQVDMRALAPAVLADAADAARARVDAIDRDIRPWWNALSQPERERTFVVVLGSKAARTGNLAYTYFVNLLGAAEDGRRVIYAESVFDEKGADGTLAQVLTDRRLSVDFFADERRMERDLLADGVEAYLLQLFGRLGTP